MRKITDKFGNKKIKILTLQKIAKRFPLCISADFEGRKNTNENTSNKTKKRNENNSKKTQKKHPKTVKNKPRKHSPEPQAPKTPQKSKSTARKSQIP